MMQELSMKGILYSIGVFLAYHARQDFGTTDCYGRVQFDHGRSVFRIP